MFDFQKLIVYQKSIDFNDKLRKEIISKKTTDRVIRDQLRRAGISIPLNIAEGTSRYSKADRRHFYTISKGSLYECIAVLDILKKDDLIEIALYETLNSIGEEISKMLFALEKKLI